MKVSVDRFIYESDAFIRKHCEYLNRLAAINRAENAEVDAMPGDNHRDKWDSYCETHKEKVEDRERQREVLKQSYGNYSSYISCPYWCLVRNVQELKKLVKPGECNYKHWKDDLYKYRGKTLCDEHDDDNKAYGKYVGLAVFVDDVYQCVKDSVTGEYHFWFDVKEYKPNPYEGLPYSIVTNGKDYL